MESLLNGCCYLGIVNFIKLNGPGELVENKDDFDLLCCYHRNLYKVPKNLFGLISQSPTISGLTSLHSKLYDLSTRPILFRPPT